ncbi:MAG TPA: cytochrome-c oxidase, cbb3-type subunit III [Gammaproteobacteria bacterium]|nr:cytochrome-c oxidase, cbb3-type subunit III [Gammaproteobacteria bacterium]
MTHFWSGFIILAMLLMLLGVIWLLFVIPKYRASKFKKGEISEHGFDTIKERNKPVHRWLIWLFGFTVILTIVYLTLYPGLGGFSGLFGWSSTKAWENEAKKTEQHSEPLYAQYAQVPFKTLIQDKEAMNSGNRLFSQYCTNCHGETGQGMPNFPNLTDDSWLYGKEPEQIKQSILFGRTGFMPGFEAVLENEEKIQAIVQYVLSLSKQPYDATQAQSGEPIFKTICAACHGLEGHGNTMIGAPDLTRNIWTYGGSPSEIEKTIRFGRQSQMPAHEKLLSTNQAHLLAAYIYSLSLGSTSEPHE